MQVCVYCRRVETANAGGACTGCIGSVNRQGRVVYRCVFCFHGTYTPRRVCCRCEKRARWHARPISPRDAQETRRRESLTNRLCQDTRPLGQPACLIVRERAAGIDQWRAFRVVWVPLGRLLTLLGTCSTIQEAEAVAQQDIADLAAISTSWQRIATRIEQLHRYQRNAVGITAGENLELVNLTRIAKKCGTIQEARQP